MAEFRFICRVCGGEVRYAKEDDASGVHDRHYNLEDCVIYLRKKVEAAQRRRQSGSRKAKEPKR